MHQNEWNKLQKIERLARGSVAERLIHDPVRYLSAILYWRVLYPLNKKGRFASAQTFFNTEMEVILPSATEIYLFGAKTHDSEIRLARFLMKNLSEGDSFCDVGAHFGYFSLLAAHLTGPKGKVCAFEASATTFGILEKNTAGLSQIHCFHRAVSDSEAQLVFYEYPALYSEYNSLLLPEGEQAGHPEAGLRKRLEVSGIRLDDFFSAEDFLPDIIKIDVEGAEPAVLRGMRHHLETHAPVLVMEYLSGHSQQKAHREAVAWIRDHGYRTYIIHNNGDVAACEEIERSMKERGLTSDNVVLMKSEH